ncbi:MAG: hypothetical protein AAGA48_00520 [Myxococcota bacterium]
MPMILRIAILGLFAGVFVMAVLPSIIGMITVRYQTQQLMEDFAATEEDRALAQDLNERAFEAGSDLKFDPQAVAHARRMGQLDEVHEVADEMFGQQVEHVEPDTTPRRHNGAFYRDANPEPEVEGGMPLWVGLLAVVGLVFASLAALGAAFTSLMSRSDPGS